MAFTSSIGDTKICLVDGFPGLIQNIGAQPEMDVDGKILTNPAFFNVLKGPWKNGTKIMLIDPVNGPAIFMYAKLGSVSTAAAAGMLFTMEQSSGVLTGFLTNHNTYDLVGGPVAMALGAVTALYSAWWQVGGRPAITLVPALDSDTLCGTDGSVVEGAMALIENDSSLAFCVHAAGKKVVGYAGGADA